jgi:protein SCO1/2
MRLHRFRALRRTGPNRSRAPLRTALALTGAAAIVPAMIACGSGSATHPAAGTGFAGAALPAGVPAHDFTLEDQSGRRVSLAGYRGRVVILAFISSTCGATCILLAQQIRGALDELPRPVPVLFVSVDPRADTGARVRRFLERVALTGRASYLSGSPAALKPIWRAYGVVPVSSDRAAFERAASVLLLDRTGRERVVFGVEQLTPEGIAHDVRKLS